MKDFEERFGAENEMTPEEEKAAIRHTEATILDSLLSASEFTSAEDEYFPIAIHRTGKEKPVFSFRVRGLTEEEFHSARKTHTPRIKNKAMGNILVDGETNFVKYRSQVIYNATHPEDRALIWDNKGFWAAKNILTGIDAIDLLLKAGEKDKVYEKIEEISGYAGELEDLAKN